MNQTDAEKNILAPCDLSVTCHDINRPIARLADELADLRSALEHCAGTPYARVLRARIVDASARYRALAEVTNTLGVG